MSEQEFLRKCEAAFPGIKDGIDNAFESSNLLRELDPENKESPQRPQALAKELGFPESGSIMIDSARAARGCDLAFRKEEDRQQAERLVNGAEYLMAQSILNGAKEFKLFELGRGIGRLQNAMFDPPELTSVQKQVFEGVNKIPFLKAEVVKDQENRSQFYMVMSLKKLDK